MTARLKPGVKKSTKWTFCTASPDLFSIVIQKRIIPPGPAESRERCPSREIPSFDASTSLPEFLAAVFPFGAAGFVCSFFSSPRTTPRYSANPREHRDYGSDYCKTKFSINREKFINDLGRHCVSQSGVSRHSARIESSVVSPVNTFPLSKSPSLEDLSTTFLIRRRTGVGHESCKESSRTVTASTTSNESSLKNPPAAAGSGFMQWGTRRLRKKFAPKQKTLAESEGGTFMIELNTSLNKREYVTDCQDKIVFRPKYFLILIDVSLTLSFSASAFWRKIPLCFILPPGATYDPEAFSKTGTRALLLFSGCSASSLDYRFPCSRRTPGANCSGDEQKETVASAFLRGLQSQEYEVRSAAEAMPEDKYSYRPADGKFKN